MRHALNALTDELRRMKTSGVKVVAISEESVATLRRTLQARPRPAAVSAAPQSVSAAATAAGSKVSSVVPKAYEPPPMAPVRKVAPAAEAGEELPAPPEITLPKGDKQARWNALLAQVRADPICQRQLRPGKQVVLGVGTLDAKIMFVGEAPGAEEELQGEPFVGPAGQLLTKMIQAMGVKREEVYIGNIMNWRPRMPVSEGAEQVGNRPPTEREMSYCQPFLRAQIEIVNPALLVALGSTAAQGLLGFGSFKALGEIRGQWREFSGKPLMVTYHPSYILRNQSSRSKRMIWEDLLKVMERVELPISARQRAFFLDA
jgi:DNA polymerase